MSNLQAIQLENSTISCLIQEHKEELEKIPDVELDLDLSREFRYKQYPVVYLLLKNALKEFISTAPPSPIKECKGEENVGFLYLYDGRVPNYMNDAIKWKKTRMSVKLIVHNKNKGVYKLKNHKTDEGNSVMRRQTWQGNGWRKNEYKLIKTDTYYKPESNGTFSVSEAPTLQNFPVLVHYFRKNDNNMEDLEDAKASEEPSVGLSLGPLPLGPLPVVGGSSSPVDDAITPPKSRKKSLPLTENSKAANSKANKKRKVETSTIRSATTSLPTLKNSGERTTSTFTTVSSSTTITPAPLTTVPVVSSSSSSSHPPVLPSTPTLTPSSSSNFLSALSSSGTGLSISASRIAFSNLFSQIDRSLLLASSNSMNNLNKDRDDDLLFSSGLPSPPSNYKHNLRVSGSFLALIPPTPSTEFGREEFSGFSSDFFSPQSPAISRIVPSRAPLPIATPSPISAAIRSYAPEIGPATEHTKMIIVVEGPDFCRRNFNSIVVDSTDASDNDDIVITCIFDAQELPVTQIASGVFEFVVPPHAPGLVHFWLMCRRSSVNSVSYTSAATFYATPSDEDARLSLVFHNLESEDITRDTLNKFRHTVKELDLSNNSLTDVDFLEDFYQLHTLILDNNQITAESKLPMLPKLVALYVNCNAITLLEPFLDQIKVCFPSLQYLSLLGNEACPVFSKSAHRYYNYRIYVISKLRKLSQLDSSPVSAEEWKHAACIIPGIGENLNRDEDVSFKTEPE